MTKTYDDYLADAATAAPTPSDERRVDTRASDAVARDARSIQSNGVNARRGQ